MACIDQVITDQYAIYNGDCCEGLQSIPDASVHLSVYSPPFAAEGAGCLYHYSSSERDLSNCRSHAEFFEHYSFVVSEIHRVTMPGRHRIRDRSAFGTPSPRSRPTARMGLLRDRETYTPCGPSRGSP